MPNAINGAGWCNNNFSNSAGACWYIIYERLPETDAKGSIIPGQRASLPLVSQHVNTVPGLLHGPRADAASGVSAIRREEDDTRMLKPASTGTCKRCEEVPLLSQGPLQRGAVREPSTFNFRKHLLRGVHLNSMCAAAVSNVSVCAEAVYFFPPNITRQST